MSVTTFARFCGIFCRSSRTEPAIGISPCCVDEADDRELIETIPFATIRDHDKCSLVVDELESESMAKAIQPSEERLKLQAICERIGVDYDDARYTMAKGAIPKGIASEPGKGNHRVFGTRDAFMVAIILKVRAAGVSTSIAKQIAEWSTSIQMMAVDLGWDWQFAPFAGKLHSDKKWFLEIGDNQFARVITNASPSKRGYESTYWVEMATLRKRRTARPAVIFRVDIVRIAQLLAGTSAPE
jgi:hypothetical protein